MLAIIATKQETIKPLPSNNNLQPVCVPQSKRTRVTNLSQEDTSEESVPSKRTRVKNLSQEPVIEEMDEKINV